MGVSNVGRRDPVFVFDFVRLLVLDRAVADPRSVIRCSAGDASLDWRSFGFIRFWVGSVLGWVHWPVLS